MAKKVAVIVGSLRKEAFTRKLANAAILNAPNTIELEIIEIGQLPLYNQDFDDESRPPIEWVEFRKKMKPFEGVLFVTPEYNRSIPGVLKNAIDVGSRPYGKSIWSGKPGAILSVSPGVMGGFGANHHLRQCMVFLNVPCMQEPEAYIGGAGKLFDSKGELIQESTREFLRKFMSSYSNWVTRLSQSIEPSKIANLHKHVSI